MLKLDDKDFKIPDSFVKMIENKPGDDLIFKICSRFEYYDKDNKRWRRPNSISIECFYQFKKEGDSQDSMLRWAKNRIQKGGSGQDAYEYTPGLLTFNETGKIIVKKDKMDLIFFLYYSHDNEGNKDRSTRKEPKFYLENLEKIAQETAIDNSKLATAINLIWSKKEGLPVEELRAIAKSMNIAGVDQMSDEAVQNSLHGSASKKPAEFIAKTSGQMIALRGLLQDAVDMDLIRYDVDSRNWSYKNRDDGTVGEIICNIAPGGARQEGLVKFLTKEDRGSVLQSIEGMVKQKRRSLEPADPDDDGDSEDKKSPEEVES